jgi:hypothetical protein
MVSFSQWLRSNSERYLLERIRWMVEELRVSLFAEALGTPEPVSEKRVYRAMDQLSS